MAKNEKETLMIRPEDKIEEAILNVRRIFLAESVGNESAEEIIRKLWYMELNDSEKPILFVINSPGGSVDSGFAIWDQIKMIKAPITTLITGLAASMGSVLALCAPKGRRFATPEARLMIHQPMLGSVIQGQATDLEIQAKEIIRTRERLEHIYQQATGQDREKIKTAIERDTWMNAEEAKKFGLIDEIVKSYADLQKKGFAC